MSLNTWDIKIKMTALYIYTLNIYSLNMLWEADKKWEKKKYFYFHGIFTLIEL